MALSRNEIEKNSNARRGIKAKKFAIKSGGFALCERLAAETGQPQSRMFSEALTLYAQWLKSQGVIS